MTTQTIKTNWREYLEKYRLVLFNCYPELVNKFEAWDEIPAGTEEDDDGNYREVYQWYIIDINHYEAECMAEETDGEVVPFYSEIIQNYILPVYHLGTPWNGVPLTVKRKAK